MAHVILTGCTGTAGAAILAHCIESTSIARISVLSRRPVQQAEGQEGKVTVHIHADFGRYEEELLGKLRGAVGCIWALGISTSQVKASEYKIITYDYPLAAAKAFATLSPSFNFVYISGEGVTRTPTRLTPLFSLHKGRAESSLLRLLPTNPSLRIFNLRPGFIDETARPLKDGPAPLIKKISDVVAPVWRRVSPGTVTPTGALALVGERCVLEGGAGREEVRRGWVGGEGGGKGKGGKGVSFEEGEEVGEGVGVLVENVGIRRLAGI